MANKEALLELHNAIAEHLTAILDTCHDRGLKQVTRITVVVRDPDNDEMIVMLTNEPSNEAAIEAITIATKKPAVE